MQSIWGYMKSLSLSFSLSLSQFEFNFNLKTLLAWQKNIVILPKYNSLAFSLSLSLFLEHWIIKANDHAMWCTDTKVVYLLNKVRCSLMCMDGSLSRWTVYNARGSCADNRYSGPLRKHARLQRVWRPGTRFNPRPVTLFRENFYPLQVSTLDSEIGSAPWQ